MNGPGRPWEADPRVTVPQTRLTPAEVLETLKEAAGEAFIEGRLADWTEATKPAPAEVAPCTETASVSPSFRQVWLKIREPALHAVVERLCRIHYPHLVVIAAEDRGSTIELPYLFRIYHGPRHAEIMICITAVLPKERPEVDTISDLIPGAVLSEREKQEMMGVVVRKIPDGRRMFLPEEFPQGVYPWRKDETAPQPHMLRDLWATGRPAAPSPEPPSPPPPPVPSND